jgi:hypothetical protein
MTGGNGLPRGDTGGRAPGQIPQGDPGGRPADPILPADQLRHLVREVLADVVGKLPPQAHVPARGGHAVHAAPPSSVPRSDADGASAGADLPAPHPRSGPPGGDDASWTVRISTDEDLHAFALRVLKLAGNPKLRQDLISGRARFRLAGAAAALSAAAPSASTGQAAAHRVDKGAVTERTVAAAAAAGARLVLGPRAVLTPLGRDKARALGVPIEKER